MLSQVLCELYELVKTQPKGPGGSAAQAEGFSFEEKVSDTIFNVAKQIGDDEFVPFHARYELLNPTLSGNHYQFDASFLYQRVFFAIECKKKQIPTNENLYYFAAKLIDYEIVALHKGAISGIFLSTSKIGDAAKSYAIAYGIAAIDPNWPPLDYLISETPTATPLAKALQKLKVRITENVPSISFQNTANDPQKTIRRVSESPFEVVRKIL